MTRYSDPMRCYSCKDGWTWGVFAYEDEPGLSVWDEDSQMFLAAPTPVPLVMMDFGEPYETPDGP